ncbi:uncharacterized protein LOC142350283 isoform X2 [Convolutriloba macropyga]|uniref:uncharacterized protein LOC142350283 isoform X2 n=1 Tax=Convolutriloba macropyga TaxID=536237 RepID=UPI003F5260A5
MGHQQQPEDDDQISVTSSSIPSHVHATSIQHRQQQQKQQQTRGSVLGGVRSYLVLSAVNLPDQIVDIHQWIRNSQRGGINSASNPVVERRVLIVDGAQLSPERPQCYVEATVKGVQISDILQRFIIQPQLNISSNLDSRTPIPDSPYPDLSGSSVLEDLRTVEFHSYFNSNDEDQRGGGPVKLPLSFCLSSGSLQSSAGILIATEMDGHKLDIESGGPFCLVTPGYIAYTPNNYSIHTIRLTNEQLPSTPHQMTMSPLEIPLMSYLVQPSNASTVGAREEVKCYGVAFTGGGKSVRFVEFSVDEGQTWTACFADEEASTQQNGQCYTLKNFQFTLEMRQLPRNSNVIIRATDQNWISQPISAQQLRPDCPYDNSCFKLELKDLPNNKRAFIYPGSANENPQDVESGLSLEPKENDGGAISEAKKALRSHFIEYVLPVKLRGLRPTNGLSEAVSRTVGGYKKRDIGATKSQELGCQVNAVKDLTPQEPKWRKTLSKQVEIELRPVDERKLRPFHSTFIPTKEKPGGKAGNTVKSYSREEVMQHNTPEDCWIIIREHVYDITRLVKQHPIGSELFAAYAGTECSYAFEACHESHIVSEMLDEYYLGKLQTFVNKAMASNLVVPSWGSLTLIEKRQLTHDVYEFTLRSKTAMAKVPLGAHFYLTLNNNNSNNKGKSKQAAKVTRPYNLIGGSGVSAMMGLIDRFLPMGNEIILVCCNRTEDDIIYRSQLNEYAKEFPNLSLHHAIEVVPVTAQYRWNYFSGLLQEKHMNKVLKGGSKKDDYVFLCGRWTWLIQLREMLINTYGYNERQFINF